jgi:hypothetical protein
MTNVDFTDKIVLETWLDGVMNGNGGFVEWEQHFEYTGSREIAFAAFVLRCLTNPSCDGSEMVFNSILQEREFSGDNELLSFGV